MLTADTIRLGTDANLELNGRIAGGAAIANGTNFTLMEASNSITGNFTNIDDIHTLYQGIALEYAVATELTSTILSAKIIGTDAQEQAKVPAMAQAASVAMLNQGADLLSGAGLDNALKVTSVPLG